MNNSATNRSEVRPRAGSRNAPLAILLVLCLIAAPTWAAFVTTQQEKLNTLIFDSHNFDSDTIELRFNPTETLIDADLLDVNAPGEFGELKSLANGLLGLAPNIIRLFFVDTLSCNGSASSVGCAEVGGNDVMVESIYAANPTWGHILIGHEIGHNLGLTHLSAMSTPGNVMLGTVSNAANVNFLPAQIDTIDMASHLIQYEGPGNSGQRFINITPVLVSAAITTVPIPGAIWLLLSAVASIGVSGRKNREHCIRA